ncbi:hypothetical protein CWI39_0909p0030 [Hamiltosporidium magnivora]|uniref:Uncharacterized protein n=1 Tax=Hamiltosporidium magnivora TaxID=148818 RepID=A0A4Q9L7X3_9MICR|nr:hypothetical protein CWI39_0909p0030 [Hamiltosporidium magnivora]
MSTKLFKTYNLSLIIENLSSLKILNKIKKNRICIKGGVKDMKIKILKNTLNFLIFKYKEIEKNIFQSNFSVKRYKEVINIYKGVSYKIESVNTSILNEIYKLFYRRIGRECNVYNGISIYECGNKDSNKDRNVERSVDSNKGNIDGNIDRSIERSIEGNKYITNEDYNIERSIEDITECNIDFNRFVEFDVNDEELKVLERIYEFIDRGVIVIRSIVKRVLVISSKEEGVNKSSRIKGVSNMIEGVSNSSSKEEGVSNSSSKEEGVSNNNKDSKSEGVNNYTMIKRVLVISTMIKRVLVISSKEDGVSNNSKEEGVNNKY